MYDRYQGVQELMAFAKAVSAKSHEFDEQGNEVQTDYMRMMKIVIDAGYRGYVGIEYEGTQLSEHDGIAATKLLLERVREQLANAGEVSGANGRSLFRQRSLLRLHSSLVITNRQTQCEAYKMLTTAAVSTTIPRALGWLNPL